MSKNKTGLAQRASAYKSKSIHQRYCDFEVALAKMSKMIPILYTNIFDDIQIIFQKISK